MSAAPEPAAAVDAARDAAATGERTVLALDTATAATVAGLWRAGGAEAIEARHEPAGGERPGHATQALALAEAVLAAAGVDWDAVDRIAVGTGPGSFTGLRIGVATARALAQARGVELVGVSTLRALALGIDEADPAGERGAHVAVIDARRGEVFAAGWDRAGTLLLAPGARTPAALAAELAALGGSVLAAGDGSLRFRETLETAGAVVDADDSPVHRVAGRHLCRLGLEAQPAGLEAVLPDYLREPDAQRRAPSGPAPR